uniref:Peptidase S26 domain-containing protein n=1 Tax=Corvus moneduloides TaxID=1196302 RepID=A0A8C3EZD3_CORMO
ENMAMHSECIFHGKRYVDYCGVCKQVIICFSVMVCNDRDCSSFTSPWNIMTDAKSRRTRNFLMTFIMSISFNFLKHWKLIALEGDIIKTIGYKKKYVKVPHGHIWVEGDHHGHSFDSNAFGPVSLGLLHARATHILWPPQRWQKLQPMLPPERKPLHREQE